MNLLLRTAAAAFFMTSGGAVHAACTPVASDVVSLGEKAARFYSERSLTAAVEAERQRLASAAMVSGRITRAMTCQPFPNLLGADEWRCVGKGKVCSK
jgi:hypothetical protein